MGRADMESPNLVPFERTRYYTLALCERGMGFVTGVLPSSGESGYRTTAAWGLLWRRTRDLLFTGTRDESR